MGSPGLVKLVIGKEPTRNDNPANKTLFYINIYDRDLAHKMFLAASKHPAGVYLTSNSQKKSMTSYDLSRNLYVYGRFWVVQAWVFREKKMYYIFRDNPDYPAGEKLGIDFKSLEGKDMLHDFLNILKPIERSKVILLLDS